MRRRVAIALVAATAGGCMFIDDFDRFYEGEPRDAGLDAAAPTEDAGADAATPIDGCVPSGAEVCNGVDDDCNGATDEGPPSDCDMPNAMTACNGGACEVVGCEPGFLDCDDAVAGCERATTWSSCGGCDTACDPRELCVSAACVTPTGDWMIQTSGNVRALGLDEMGRAYVGVQSTAAFDFDGRGFSLRSTPHGVLARVEPDGTVEWTQLLWGRGASSGVNFVEIAARGDHVYVAGYYTGTGASLLGEEAPASESNDAFLLDVTREGAVRWAHYIDGASTQQAEAVTIDPDGNAIFLGFFHQNLSFDDAPVDTLPGYGTWVVSIAPDGTRNWITVVDDVGASQSVAAAGDGTVFTGGRLEGTATLGGTTFTANNFHPLLVALDGATGSYVDHAWLDPTSTCSGEEYHFAGIAADAPGNLYFAGGCGDASIDIGGPGPLPGGVWIAGFDGSLGFRWQRSLGTVLDGVYLGDIAYGPDGDLALAGQSGADRDVDRLPTARQDWFVIRYGPDGDYRGGLVVHASVWTNLFEVAPGAGGRTVLSGNFSGTLDVGGLTRDSADGASFVLSLSP